MKWLIFPTSIISSSFIFKELLSIKPECGPTVYMDPAPDPCTGGCVTCTWQSCFNGYSCGAGITFICLRFAGNVIDP